MSAEAASNILFNEYIKASDDPISAREEKIIEYRKMYANPFEAAT
jgi:hypothetical protein